MKTKISLLILLLGIYATDAGAQISSDPNYIITITHLTKEKVKYIVPGKKITIWYGGGKVKGRLTAITPDNIFINNSAYSPEQIIKIRALLPGSTAGGAVVTAGGTGTLALGGYLAAISIIAIAEAGGESWVVFWGTLGLLGSAPLIGLGAVLVPVGIIIITQGRTFDLVSKWKLSVVRTE